GGIVVRGDVAEVPLESGEPEVEVGVGGHRREDDPGPVVGRALGEQVRGQHSEVDSGVFAVDQDVPAAGELEGNRLLYERASPLKGDESADLGRNAGKMVSGGPERDGPGP